jgi:hypothetical protein
MVGVNYIKIKHVGILIFMVVSFLSCNNKPTSPGYVYFPDMTYSQAYETYSENPNFVNNMTLRNPVEGTIPRGYMPFPYEKTEKTMASSVGLRAIWNRGTGLSSLTTSPQPAGQPSKP